MSRLGTLALDVVGQREGKGDGGLGLVLAELSAHG